MTRARALAAAAVGLVLALTVPWPQLSPLLRPDLAVLVVVAFAVTRAPAEALAVAAALGLAQDALSAARFGGRAVTLMLVAWAVGRVAAGLHTEAASVRAALVAGAVLGAAVVERVLAVLLPTGAVVVGPRATVAAAVATVVCAALVWPWLTRSRRERAAW